MKEMRRIITTWMLMTAAVSAPDTATAQAAPAAAAAAAQKYAYLTTLKRGPANYMDYGDVAGLSPAVMASLGVAEGGIVEVRTKTGLGFGFEAKPEAALDGKTLMGKKSVRDALGATEGPVELFVTPIAWPTADPRPVPVQFSTVIKPSKSFLRFGKAAGISLARMRAMGAGPGQNATATAAGGKTTEVTLRVAERGDAAVSIGLVVRKALGIDGPGAAVITLVPKPGRVAAPPPSSVVPSTGAKPGDDAVDSD